MRLLFGELMSALQRLIKHFARCRKTRSSHMKAEEPAEDLTCSEDVVVKQPAIPTHLLLIAQYVQTFVGEHEQIYVCTYLGRYQALCPSRGRALTKLVTYPQNNEVLL